MGSKQSLLDAAESGDLDKVTSQLKRFVKIDSRNQVPTTYRTVIESSMNLDIYLLIRMDKQLYCWHVMQAK
jgi:hypothetical protein